MAFTQLITVCIDISLDKQRPNNSLYSLFCRSPCLSGRGPVTVDFHTALFKQSTKRSRALQGRLDILNPVSKEHWCASVHAHRHARQCSNPTLSFLFKIKCQITSRQCEMLFVCRWSLIFTGNDCLSLIITCSRECVSGLFCHLAFGSKEQSGVNQTYPNYWCVCHRNMLLWLNFNSKASNDSKSLSPTVRWVMQTKAEIMSEGFYLPVICVAE